LDEIDILQISKELNKRISKLIWSDNHNKAMATLWEFLLEIERAYPKSSGTIIHKATIGKKDAGNSWITEQVYSDAANARLLRSCLKMKSFNRSTDGAAERRKYFSERILKLRKSLGAETTPTEYFLSYFSKIHEKLSSDEEKYLRKLCGENHV
jgi:hypothetical protein